MIVITGLLLLGGAFLWISQTGTQTPYPVIALQMIVMGTGLGLTTAPATESILSVLPPAKAGVGSAVNDATREAGGTLGVAIIGSVYTSLYAAQLLHGAARHLPAHLLQVTQGSVGAGYAIAGRVPRSIHRAVLHSVTSSFMTGLHAGCLVAAAVCVLGALGSGFLPGRSQSAPLPAAVASVPAG